MCVRFIIINFKHKNNKNTVCTCSPIESHVAVHFVQSDQFDISQSVVVPQGGVAQSHGALLHASTRSNSSHGAPLFAASILM